MSFKESHSGGITTLSGIGAIKDAVNTGPAVVVSKGAKDANGKPIAGETETTLVDNGINRDTDNTQLAGNTITTGALEVDITVDVAALVNAVDNIKNLPENLKEIGKKIEAAGKAVVAAKEKLSEALAKLSPAKQQEVKEQVGAVLLASNDKYYAVSLETDEEYRKELAKIPQSDYEARTELQTKHALKKNALEVQKLEKEKEILTKAAEFIKGEEGMVVNPVTGLHVPYLDSEGLVTVGYGTLIDTKKDPKLADKFEQYKDGMTEADASKELHNYIKKDLDFLNNKYPNTDFRINQHVALLSLTYNLGQNNYGNTQLSKLIAGEKITKPNKNGVIHTSIQEAWTTGWAQKELQKRRGQEYALFNGGIFEAREPYNAYEEKKKTNKLFKE